MVNGLDHSRAVISIHAPVKGATNLAQRGLERLGYFNPRTREGCDLLLGLGLLFLRLDFNPRTREGCDSLQIGSVTICSLINHIAN